MIDWSKILWGSPIDWLLERSNPPVRYFTLRDVLGKTQDDPEVSDARNSIPESAVVKKIMQKQDPQGYWEKPGNPYLPKYKSSYWTLMVLGRLGMDRTDEKVAKACEFIFQFQHDDGGFCSNSIDSASELYEYRLRKGREKSSREESAKFEARI